jgi:cytochrome c biogenesis protein CcmG, thiol:disulfide interchange protein DsbE
MNNRIKLFLPALFFVVMLGLLLFGLGRDPNQVPSALVSRSLPVFEKPDLFDTAATISSAALREGIFLVSIWATWCPTCIAEHAYLMELSVSEPDLTLVGINYKDDVALAREFLDERGNPFKLNLVDVDGSLGIDFGIAAAPESFLVDSSGTIRYRHVGMIDKRVWADTFKPLLVQIQ